MTVPFEILGVPRTGGILIVVDHASNKIPEDVELQIAPALISDHIAYDIGTSDIAAMMCQNSKYLAILGGYSRLVVDLNRYASERDVIPAESDGIRIPGNQIDDQIRQARLDSYFHPYHDRLKQLIHQLQPRLLLSLHSFTTKLRSDPNIERPWDLGVLYNQYELASKLALQHLENEEIMVGDQLPYSGKNLNATMNVQAEAIGQPYFGVEIRQDLISFETGQIRFAEILQRTCDKVLSGLA